MKKGRRKKSDPDPGLVELARKLYYKNEEKISIPYLQRKLRLSYDMAEAIMDRIYFPEEFQ
jgi:DNA segregation ATPase FtsK/SpoIIIE-like protein